MNLTNEQWLVLDLLMRARQKGVVWVNKIELLESTAVPAGVRLKLAFAALTMPADLVTWRGQDFAVTGAGVDLFNAKFKKPTKVADAIIALPEVICLPGPEAYKQ